MSRPADLLGALALAGLVALGVWIFATGERPLDRSAVGLRGLVVAVRAAGLEIRYVGDAPFEAASVGLRILPILDTELDRPFERPEDDAAYLATGTERDLTRFVVQRKTERLPTMVIAPKWTRALRHSGYAHESLLLPPAQARSGVALFGAWRGPLLRPGGVLTFEVDGRTGVLYEPQLFPATLNPGCMPELSAGRGHLVLRCERRGERDVWLLSDPDLMNNHGLALGDNAEIVADLLARIADDGAILVDTTQRLLSYQRPPGAPARAWSDLLRLFAWPYAIAWSGLVAFTSLMLWRAWRRFGAPRRLFDDRIGAARGVSIGAKARVLRMAGNDPQLFAAHVANRLRAIEQRLFGAVGGGAALARIEGYLGRRDRALAAGFSRAATAAMHPPGGASPAHLMSLLDDFERAAEKVMNEAR